MLKVITQKITQDDLYGFCDAHFKTFVKFVADVKHNILAIGGELHADTEALLLENGSIQQDLWGGNFYPWKDPSDRLEFTSFINIRPRNNNPNMEVLDETIRNHIRELCERLLLKTDETMSLPEPGE
ncbi:hypothetical protein HQ585_19545 [candidate division KSB1 bacterium]|nr:hypothetical protein [candidate division KSB1 bacterium]